MSKRTLMVVFFALLYSVSGYSAECVILLHGLIRTANSMEKLETELSQNGYFVANIDYPSREKSIEELAETAVNAGLARCREANASPVNFVTHSMGGILVRYYYSTHKPSNLKRVVMLGPPNHGSEAVDYLKDFPGFELINGPAGRQLGTDSGSLPNRLGPVNFELGVIAGTQTISPILSLYLPDPDDGKVSLESTKVAGMCAFVALPVTHTFMMRDETVISEVLHFLGHGRFQNAFAKKRMCDGSS